MSVFPLTPDQFAEKVQEISRALWCVAVGVTGDRTAAEDLVQEAAMVALGKLNEFDPRTSFLAWMGQIVRFLALNERRKRGRERSAHVKQDFQDAASPRPIARKTGTIPVTSRGMIKSDQFHFDDHLTEAIASLDEIQRSCLLLKVVMGIPYREIAHTLGIPEGTAMSHVHRARRILKEKLAESSTDPGEKRGLS